MKERIGDEFRREQIVIDFAVVSGRKQGTAPYGMREWLPFVEHDVVVCRPS
jgi:hypothetical protein